MLVHGDAEIILKPCRSRSSYMHIADFNLHMQRDAAVPKSPEEALSEYSVIGFFFTCLSSDEMIIQKSQK